MASLGTSPKREPVGQHLYLGAHRRLKIPPKLIKHHEACEVRSTLVKAETKLLKFLFFYVAWFGYSWTCSSLHFDLCGKKKVSRPIVAALITSCQFEHIYLLYIRPLDLRNW